MKVEESHFLTRYKKEMLNIMVQLFPDKDSDTIESIIEDEMLKRVQSPKVTLDNNYTHESRETSLLSVIDWSLDRKPIIAGNGTFYKNQNEAKNPIAQMLNEFLTNRKRYKKLMFENNDPTSARYQDLDRYQKNEKISVNSYYGASGAPSSAFYSKWSGPKRCGTSYSDI